jgi:hypothetical protein
LRIARYAISIPSHVKSKYIIAEHSKKNGPPGGWRAKGQCNFISFQQGGESPVVPPWALQQNPSVLSDEQNPLLKIQYHTEFDRLLLFTKNLDLLSQAITG